MIVYADILIALNFIVDYFLLSLTAKLLRRIAKLLRLLLGAAIGALSSLYIFLPQSFWVIELGVRLIISAVMALAAFGFLNIKAYIRSVAVLFSVTFGYAGIMMAFWTIFKPQAMIINNSVVYFDISAITLTVCSVICYIAVTVIRSLLIRRTPNAGVCKIKLMALDNSIEVNAIIDSGNSIEDILCRGEVIITDSSVIDRLFGSYSKEDSRISSRYRLLPCDTVSGTTLLEGLRCDRAIITYQNKQLSLSSPIVASSNTRLDTEYPAIINPKVLEEI